MKPLHSERPAGTAVRLLIPIDATEESRWGVRYAVRLAAGGVRVEACLLYVAEPVRSWEVLRFYTEDEIRRHFQARSEVFLEEAATPLRDAGISCASYFREADAVDGVVAAAEELNCSEIVVPQTLWLGLFPSGLGARLIHRHCPIPVVLTDAEGAVRN